MIRAERPFQSCVDRRRAFPRAAFPIFLVAALCASGASAAETARSSLFVGATVEPSCVVSTAAQTGVARPTSVSCSNFGDGSVAIEQDQGRSASTDSTGRTAEPAAGEDSTRSGEITYVTISY